MSEIKIEFDNNKAENFSKEKLTIDIFELMCYIGEPNIKLAEKIVNTIYDKIISDNRKKILEKDLKKYIKEVLKENSSDLLQAFIINKKQNKNKNFDLDLEKRIFKYVFDINKDLEDINTQKYINNIKNQYISLDTENKENYNKIFKYVFKGIFYPSLNILKNINNKYRNLLSSYSIKIEDYLESIFINLKLNSLLQKRNCSTSVNLTNIRSKKEVVSSIKRKACGPGKIIDLYYSAKKLIGSNNIKNSNNLFYINVEHKDILDFIKKSEKYKNINFVILLNNRFMNYLIKNQSYIIKQESNKYKQKNLLKESQDLKEHKNKNTKREINTNNIFNRIVNSISTYNNLDLVFIDHINKNNIFKDYKDLEISSVGYQPTFKKDGFVTGTIDLSKFVINVGQLQLFNWKYLKEVILDSIEFLDNCIDISKDLNNEFENIKKNTRRIYLSITGFAKLLYKLNIKYNSQDALLFAEKLSEFISYYSKLKSVKLAKQKGPFNKYIKSRYDNNYFNFKTYKIQKTLFNDPKLARKILANKPKTDWVELKNKIKKYGIRNSTTYSIIFSDFFTLVNDTTNSVNPLEYLKYKVNIGGFEKEKIYKPFRILESISKDLSKEEISKLIKKNKISFSLAKTIDPEYFVKIQHAFRKYCDGVCNCNIYFKENIDLEKIKNTIIKSYNLDNRVFLPKQINNKSCIYFNSIFRKNLKSL